MGRDPGACDCQPRGDESAGRHDDVIACADSVTAEDEMQRVEAVAGSRAFAHSAIRRELALKGLDLFTEDVPAALHPAMPGCVEFAAQFEIRRPGIEERNGHAAC